MPNTIPFFLVNRELAGLVLDHLDHKTIGTFRLLCKSADACAKGAFLRTSTRACLSTDSMHATLDLPFEFKKAKLAFWETVVIADHDGLLALSRSLDSARVQEEVALSSVTTVFIGKRCRQYTLPYRKWALEVFAMSVKPLNLCLGLDEWDTDLTGILFGEKSSWRLDNLVWHSMRTSKRGPAVPALNYHVFWDTTLPKNNGMLVLFPPSPERRHRVQKLQTVTFRNRPPATYYHDASTRVSIESDRLASSTTAEDLVLETPGGLRYCFPFSPIPDKCSFCGCEL